MPHVVVGARHSGKVLDPVVVLDSVEVVDDVGFWERDAVCLLPDNMVLQPIWFRAVRLDADMHIASLINRSAFSPIWIAFSQVVGRSPPVITRKANGRTPRRWIPTD